MDQNFGKKIVTGISWQFAERILASAVTFVVSVFHRNSRRLVAHCPVAVLSAVNRQPHVLRGRNILYHFGDSVGSKTRLACLAMMQFFLKRRGSGHLAADGCVMRFPERFVCGAHIFKAEDPAFLPPFSVVVADKG